MEGAKWKGLCLLMICGECGCEWRGLCLMMICGECGCEWRELSGGGCV